MSCLEKRHVSHRLSMQHHHFIDGFSDCFMDETDREVMNLTDRAFRSLCIGDEAVYNDSEFSPSPISCHKPLADEIPKNTALVGERHASKPVNGEMDTPWRQKKNVTQVSSLFAAFTEKNCVGTKMTNGECKDNVNKESWDKSALLSIRRELSEFSSDYHNNLTDGHFSLIMNHHTSSEKGTGKKASKDVAVPSGKSSKSKHGKSSKLKKLNSKNFFLHSEFSPFQSWRDFNRFPFGQDISDLLPTSSVPKWYDSPLYKELTAAHRLEAPQVTESEQCQRQIEPPQPKKRIAPLPPPKPIQPPQPKKLIEPLPLQKQSEQPLPKIKIEPPQPPKPTEMPHMPKQIEMPQQPKQIEVPQPPKQTEMPPPKKQIETSQQPKQIEVPQPPKQTEVPPPKNQIEMPQQPKQIETPQPKKAIHTPQPKIQINPPQPEIVQTSSPMEQRCPSERGDAIAPWRRNRNRVKGALPVSQRHVSSPLPKPGEEGIFPNRREVKMMEEPSSKSSTPFSICQLLTPVIPSRQGTETSEILQAALSPAARDLHALPETEAKPLPEIKRDSYKAIASSILFNLKDNRKRVKSMYSPPKFKVMDATEPSKRSPMPEMAVSKNTLSVQEVADPASSSPMRHKARDTQSSISPASVSSNSQTAGLKPYPDAGMPDDYLITNLLQSGNQLAVNENCRYGGSPNINSKSNKSPVINRAGYPSLNLYKKASPSEVDIKNMLALTNTAPLAIARGDLNTGQNKDHLVKEMDITTTSVKDHHVKEMNITSTSVKDHHVKEMNIITTPVKDHLVKEMNIITTPVKDHLVKEMNIITTPVKDHLVKEMNITTTPVKDHLVKEKDITKSVKDHYVKEKNNASKSLKDVIKELQSKSNIVEPTLNMNKPVSNSNRENLPVNRTGTQTDDPGALREKYSLALQRKDNVKQDAQVLVRGRNQPKSEFDAVGEESVKQLTVKEKETSKKEARAKHVFSSRLNNYIKSQRYTVMGDDGDGDGDDGDDDNDDDDDDDDINEETFASREDETFKNDMDKELRYLGRAKAREVRQDRHDIGGVHAIDKLVEDKVVVAPLRESINVINKPTEKLKNEKEIGYSEQSNAREMRQGKLDIRGVHALNELVEAKVGVPPLREGVIMKNKPSANNRNEEVHAKNDEVPPREHRYVKNGILSMKGNTLAKRNLFANKEEAQPKKGFPPKRDNNVVDKYDLAKMALEEIISERELRSKKSKELPNEEPANIVAANAQHHEKQQASEDLGIKGEDGQNSTSALNEKRERRGSQKGISASKSDGQTVQTVSEGETKHGESHAAGVQLAGPGKQEAIAEQGQLAARQIKYTERDRSGGREQESDADGVSNDKHCYADDIGTKQESEINDGLENEGGDHYRQTENETMVVKESNSYRPDVPPRKGRGNASGEDRIVDENVEEKVDTEYKELASRDVTQVQTNTTNEKGPVRGNVSALEEKYIKKQEVIPAQSNEEFQDELAEGTGHAIQEESSAEEKRPAQMEVPKAHTDVPKATERVPELEVSSTKNNHVEIGVNPGHEGHTDKHDQHSEQNEESSELLKERLDSQGSQAAEGEMPSNKKAMEMRKEMNVDPGAVTEQSKAKGQHKSYVRDFLNMLGLASTDRSNTEDEPTAEKENTKATAASSESVKTENVSEDGVASHGILRQTLAPSSPSYANDMTPRQTDQDSMPSNSSKEPYISGDGGSQKHLEQDSSSRPLSDLESEVEVCKATENASVKGTEDSKKAGLDYYAFSDGEPSESDISDRQIISPQSDLDKGGWVRCLIDPAKNLTPNNLTPTSQSNASSPAMGKPALFKVKDNTFSASPVTKTVRPVFHKTVHESAQLWSPRESLSGSERGEEDLELFKERLEVLSPQTTASTLDRSPRPAVHCSPLSASQLPSARERKGHYSRLTVPEEEESRSVVSTVSEGVDSCGTSAGDTLDETVSSAAPTEDTGGSKVPSERSGSACSGVEHQAQGKPPVVPPKSEKALRRAMRLTTKRNQKAEAKNKTERRSSEKTAGHEPERRHNGEKPVGDNPEREFHSSDSHVGSHGDRKSCSSENNFNNKLEHKTPSSDRHVSKHGDRKSQSNEKPLNLILEHEIYLSDGHLSNHGNDGHISNHGERKGRSTEKHRNDRFLHRSQSIDAHVRNHGNRRSEKNINDRQEHETHSNDGRGSNRDVQVGRSSETHVSARPGRRARSLERSTSDNYEEQRHSREKPSNELSAESPQLVVRHPAHNGLPLRRSSNEHTYAPTGPSIITQSFPMTQRRLLQDPDSGQYFVVDMPVQVTTKTFFDPETGSYVQLPVQSPGAAMSQQAASMEVRNAPLMIYHGFVPVPVSSLSSQKSNAPPGELEGFELSAPQWRGDSFQKHSREKHPYIEPVYASQDHTPEEEIDSVR